MLLTIFFFFILHHCPVSVQFSLHFNLLFYCWVFSTKSQNNCPFNLKMIINSPARQMFSLSSLLENWKILIFHVYKKKVNKNSEQQLSIKQFVFVFFLFYAYYHKITTHDSYLLWLLLKILFFHQPKKKKSHFPFSLFFR